MFSLQELLENKLNKIPQLILETLLFEKFKATGLKLTKAKLRKVAEQVLTGVENIKIEGLDDRTTIKITDEDIKYVATRVERFYGEQLEDAVIAAADRVADIAYQPLSTAWPAEQKVQQADVNAFRARLERRWGKALSKLRMLLSIARERANETSKRRLHKKPGKAPHLEDVMLRLLVRACQVTNEIIVLLEHGLADGAIARWRTLHEIAVVSAVIAKFGEEIAERYVHYQIVESFAAIKAYERDHNELGFRPPSKRQSAKIRQDFRKVTERFGKKFGEENGWAAHHLNIQGTERLTFARLEKEAGDAFMRSPYKMASYNVHATPKAIYFRLGNLKGSAAYLAGMSNAGLVDPAQHTAVSLAEILLTCLGHSFDDLVVARVVGRLQSETPREFFKAHQKLVRDERRYRKSGSGHRRDETA